MKRTYGAILRSSALMGASSVVITLIGIVRTKAMALMLGPSGVGLLGMYGSIADFAASIAGLGINQSGVRQIAEAVASGDENRVATTVVVLRRTAALLGAIGVVGTVALSHYAAMITFGSEMYAGAVALLSLAIFLRLMSDAEGAVIQGMRRIVDLSKMNVVGAFIGATISVAIVYVFRERGVVPALIGAAATTYLVTRVYARRVPHTSHSHTPSHIGAERAALLRLGIAFMASGVLMTGAAYLVRIILLRQVGVDAVGLYQAAWAIGGLYVGLLLQAMGADFYPRLTGVANDDSEGNRIINEQAQVSMLLAGPGVTATLILAPFLITLFYSSRFEEATSVLRWLCLGVAIRVISWPMGYMLLAKSLQTAFLLSELAWTAVYVLLAWVCIARLGLSGAGIAFFVTYVFHCVLIYLIVRRVSGFRWQRRTRQAGLQLVLSTGLVFGGFYVLSRPAAIALGVVIMLATGVYALRTLYVLAAVDTLPRSLRQMLSRVRQWPGTKERK